MLASSPRIKTTRERAELLRELASDVWSALCDTLLAYPRRLPDYLSGAVEALFHEGLIKDTIAVVERGASHALLQRIIELAVPSHPEWVTKISRGKSEYCSSALHRLAGRPSGSCIKKASHAWESHSGEWKESG